jgi:hypothetical protein
VGDVMLLETLAAPVAATGMFTLAWTMIAVPAGHGGSAAARPAS